MADWIVFWVIAPVSIASAVAMILAKNAVHSALLLIVNFFTLAVFFLILGSPFLFVVQIIVYAGAIMVLFLFVIMLLGVDSGVPVRERLLIQRPLAFVLGAAFVVHAEHANSTANTAAPTLAVPRIAAPWSQARRRSGAPFRAPARFRPS